MYETISSRYPRAILCSGGKYATIAAMSVIKHHETLKSDVYFQDDTLPCIVREMHDAANNLFVQMHDHEFSELVIVASGKLKHMHEGGTEKISSGDFFVIHPGSYHGYAELAPNTVVCNLLYHCNRMPIALALENFPLKNVFFPEKLCVTNADRLGRIPRRDLQTTIHLITAIRKEENAPRPLRRAICESLFSSLLLHISRSVTETYPPPSNPIQKELDFIAKNLHRKITIAELGAVSGKSASTLHREFKENTSTSPGDCIIAMRIAKARSLLEQPGSSLDSVARKTGFCCASHLSRTLRGRKMH